MNGSIPSINCFSRELQTERAFSSAKYFVVAAVIAGIASAILPFSFPLAVGAFALASWHLLSSAVVLANRSRGAWIHKVHGWVTDLNSAFYAGHLFPLTLFKSYHAAKGNLQGRPILMVNGYLGFGSTWHYQRKQLVKAGFGPIYTMNVGTGKSIKTYAKHIEEKVQEIRNETGRNDLILIGHSKGGLVSSYYATHLAPASKVRITDVITIGSPLAGTPIAKLGPGLDAQEMRSDSKFHEDLREKMKQHPEIRFSHIASSADSLIPLSSALLGDDPSRQMVVDDLGHLGLVFSSRVSTQICAWLKP